jgi:deazaflavin-dependent oxidoreductase (nitroreductase family)
MSETRTLTDRPGLFNRMMIRLMPFFTRMHVWIYRNLGGRFAGKTPAGGPILLLTTTGRHSGEKRSVALGYLDEGDNFYVVASNGGQSTEPGWSYNLKADPNAEIEYKDGKVETEVELLEGEDRDQAWGRFISAYPEYEQAEHWAGRELPLYRIPVTATD